MSATQLEGQARSCVPDPAIAPGRARIARALFLRAARMLPSGALTVVLPDGTTAVAGRPGAPVMTIHRDDFFHRLGTDGRIGFGEAYMAGDWSADDLAGALTAFASSLGRLAPAPFRRIGRMLDRRLPADEENTLAGAARNIARHYDLSNELFALFLDETMTYSCAYVEHDGQPLADAQRAKFERLCRRVQLDANDHLLEIGCGWGGFALHAASTTGSRVTAVTLSAEQASYVRKRIADAGLTDRIDVVERDYRLVEGRYSKIVSIEMIEAVGHDLPTFFATCDRLLDTDGIVAIQAITKPDQRARRTRNLDDGWIERYIFPGSLIPSITTLTAAATDGSTLVLQDAEEIGIGYAPTLAAWRRRFLANREAVRALGYDERFVRAWEFYLATAEAGFRFRYLRDFHLTFTRIGNRTLPAHPTPALRF